MRKAWVFVILAALAIGFTTPAAAQSSAARAVYDASAAVPTNVPGVRTFNPPPAGFNPLTATDEEIATYGFPPRPPQSDVEHNAQWARAMAAAKNRWNGELRITDIYHGPKRAATAPLAVSALSASAPTTGYSTNWSAFINTNTLTKWSKTSSFYMVVSEFNVPVAQQAFKSSAYESGNICDGGWDMESSWNGIDGDLDQHALLQGGTASASSCVEGSTPQTMYWAWIEWWPNSSIGEFYVNPGDDFYVATWETSATQGYVTLEDLTLQTWATYSLQPPAGKPGLIGNSAEYVVERPCCRNNGLYPLANYVQDYWANSWAVTYYDYDKDIATPYYPGSISTSNYLINMVDDTGKYTISVPKAQGKNGILFQTQECAYIGGCTP
jgi:hypothetical protein